jgi:hypothetical protein
MCVLLLNLLLDEVSVFTVLCARSFVPVVMYHTHPVRPISEMRGSDGRLKITLFLGCDAVFCGTCLPDYAASYPRQL